MNAIDPLQEFVTIKLATWGVKYKHRLLNQCDEIIMQKFR